MAIISDSGESKHYFIGVSELLLYVARAIFSHNATGPKSSVCWGNVCLLVPARNPTGFYSASPLKRHPVGTLPD